MKAKTTRAKKLLLSLFAILLPLLANAHDFEVDGIYYNITSTDDFTVGVTYKGNSHDSYSDEYTGSVIIPTEVGHNGKIYNVASIGNSAFYGCRNLTSITIPESVTSIENWAFASCFGLTAVHISNLESWCNLDIGMYYANPLYNGGYLYLNGKLITDLIIPEGVTNIGDNAFDGYAGLTSITLPEGLTSIGWSAFSGCGLTTISIPESVVNIEGFAFSNCYNLTSITIPTNVTSIQYGTFLYCRSLATVTIPQNSKLADIEKSAFSNCSSLSDIYCYTTFVPKTDLNAFDNTNLGNITLHARKNTIESYESISPWSKIGKTEILQDVAVEEIKFSDYKMNLVERESKKITATVIPADAANMSYSWSSSNEAVAIVDTEGMVTAISKGFATITATANDGSGVNASCEVQVIRLVTDITLSQTNATMKEGEALALKATVTPNSATNTSPIWNSSDTTIAIVDTTGIVRAISKGVAIITAIANDGSGVSAACEVTVRRLVQNVQLNHSSISPAEGEKINLTATISPESATDKSVAWSSSDTSIATVDSVGTVTAISKGVAIITATANDGSGVSAACEVIVRRLVTEITLSQTAATLREGDIITLKATITPSSASDITYAWSSSDESVALVYDDGSVEAISKGSATITATANDGSGVKASCKVEVIRMVEKITLSKTTATLKEGENITLKATVAPSSANDVSYTWSSSDESVATVDANGKVEAVSKGMATITATANDGSGVKAACEIEVIRMVSEIALSQTIVKIAEGEKMQLTATVAPFDANNTSCTWSSNDESVATVDADGTINAIVKGKAIITVTANDGSGVKASCEVEVVRLVTDITLDKTSVTLKENEYITLRTTVAPSDASDRTYIWSSSDESVAMVDANGRVKAVSRGFATITATANDGSGVRASCEVEVIRMVSEIVLNYTTANLEEGENLQLVATVYPDGANNASYTWSSSNEDVAMVNSKGKVVAVSLGTATITATANDGSGVKASCRVYVVIPVSKIELSHTTVTMKEGDILNLQAKILPENATDPSYTWSSDNEDVAMINSKGRVVAVAPGTATISATANDYKGVSATCVITVIDPNGIDEIATGNVVISCSDGVITIAGLARGTEAAAYDLMGRKLATATAIDGITRLHTGLTSGGTAIVRIGANSYMVIVK